MTFAFLTILPLAITVPTTQPREPLPAIAPLPALERLPRQEIVQPARLMPLPGALDPVPVLNSNNPEIVTSAGILVSSFPPEGKRSPEAHLNFPLDGRFDIFTHHIARARTQDETNTLIQGVIVHNPNAEPVTIQILQAATYATNPDAPFIELPALVEDPQGKVFAGPGGRTVSDVLRGSRGEMLPLLTLQPGEYEMLMVLPIPLWNVTPVSNGRSTLMRLQSNGPVYAANLALLAPLKPNGTEGIPTKEEWIRLLNDGTLAGPRDLSPTPLDESVTKVIYSRVAGIAEGSRWQARLQDNPHVDELWIPPAGNAFAYGLSTLHRGNLGTAQIQSAKMLARYPDTAYYAHGNYGIEYSVAMPLVNPFPETHDVTISLSNPIKHSDIEGGLLFFSRPEERVFFRGPVRVRYEDEFGEEQVKYYHTVLHRGEKGEPLLTLRLSPGDRRLVRVDLIYPPDSTPPQALVIETED